MKKETKIIIGVIAVVAILAIIITIVLINSNTKTKIEPINTAEDLSALIDKVYEGEEEVVPSSVMTQVIDVADDTAVKSVTGLDNGQDLEFVVASEPMITSQAYSFVLAKVKNGVNAEQIAKSMYEKVDTRKWICVSAEKLYATSSGDIVCLVMSSEEMAKPIYQKFKTLAGNVGKEYEKTEEETVLPDDMY